MSNHHPLESVVRTILDSYSQGNEYGLESGDDFFIRYRAEMSAEQVQLACEARNSCEGVIRHPMRHFTGGLSCFSPF